MEKHREILRLPRDYRLKKMANLCKDAENVLDVGWHEEPNQYLENNKVIGLDLETGAPPLNYEKCFVGNAMHLPAPFEPRSFDAIVAGEILEHVERPVDLLRSLREALKPGGKLIISTPNPHYPIEFLLTIPLNRKYYYTPHHIFLYPQRWLIRMMEIAGFENVQLYSGGFPFPVVGRVPCPRIICYETIASAIRV